MEWTINVSVNISNKTLRDQTVSMTLYPKFNVLKPGGIHVIQYCPTIYLRQTSIKESSTRNLFLGTYTMPNILKGGIDSVYMEYDALYTTASQIASTNFTLTEDTTGGRRSTSDIMTVTCNKRNEQLYKISPVYDLKTAYHFANLVLNISLL